MSSPRPRVLVLHGPNLNLLGVREPEVYGIESLAMIDASLVALGERLGLIVECVQANGEGVLIDRLHEFARVRVLDATATASAIETLPVRRREPAAAAGSESAIEAAIEAAIEPAQASALERGSAPTEVDHPPRAKQSASADSPSGLEPRGVVINPGGYTHTSVALRDAIAAIELPTIEVHLTNLYGREGFRHTSITGGACRGVIMGLGSESYRLALQALAVVLHSPAPASTSGVPGWSLHARA
jgi:3-dehydroquinate dehydratase-2